MSEVILDVRDLKKHFAVTSGLLMRKTIGSVKAVDGVSFAISKGEALGLVGESGCGKTTTAKLVLLLESITSGSINFRGTDVTKLKGATLRQYRSSVQAVFQDPYSSLSPRMKVREILAEPLIVNHAPSKAIKERVVDLLDLVGLNRRAADLYPHEFSGGQRQRIAVARAIALNPSLIVLDEPVSALDVSIRAQIMNLLHGLQQELALTYLFIAHDLAVVKHMCNRVGVMYLGKLVETGESEDLYRNPLHPYTQALLSAALPSHPDIKREEIVLSGEVPSPLNPPAGCRFHPRCPKVQAACRDAEPPLRGVDPVHKVACFRCA